MTIALVATLLFLIVGWGGSMIGLQGVLGALPLAALAVFSVCFVWRVVYWAKSPVPFAIPTVGGQQRSLDWITPSRLDAPWTTAAVVGRMALEVLTFRSLFRNTAAERTTINGVPRLTYYSSKWLWVFALLFHYSMLVIVVRHARFFLEPVPVCIQVIEFLDGVMQVGHPRFYLTDAVILAGLGCGVLSGFGIGGGSLLMVWMTAVLSMEQKTAQGINLLYFLPTAAAALIFHTKNQLIEWKAVVPAAIAGSVTAALAALLSANLEMSLLRKLFGGFLILVGLSEVFLKTRKA